MEFVADRIYLDKPSPPVKVFDGRNQLDWKNFSMNTQSFKWGKIVYYFNVDGRNVQLTVFFRVPTKLQSYKVSEEEFTADEKSLKSKFVFKVSNFHSHSPKNSREQKTSHTHSTFSSDKKFGRQKVQLEGKVCQQKHWNLLATDKLSLQRMETFCRSTITKYLRISPRSTFKTR